MILSTAKPATVKPERRISSNGIKYRMEFKFPDGEWAFSSLTYPTFIAAVDSMNRMNKSDDELAGDWNIVEKAREA